MTSDLDENGMEVAVVRMPLVYGVCDKKAEKNICSDILNAIYENREYEIIENETLYLMYLDDAVDALYRVMSNTQTEECKIYHVSPKDGLNKKVVVEAFLSYREKVMNVSLDGKKENVKFDGQELRRLGFSEKFSLEEGMGTYYRQYADVINSIQKGESRREQSGEQKKLFLPILETVLSFAIVQLFIYFTKGAAFYEVVDVYLIYVLIVACVLGMVPTTLAVVLSIAAKFYGLFITNQTMEMFTDYENYLWILQLFSLSVLVSYLKENYASAIAEVKRENNHLRKEITALKSINESNVEVKEVFEKRLINYKDSYAKVYDIISQLDDLESKSILFKAARVVADVMESKDVAIYTYESRSGFCRLMASTSIDARKKGKSFRLSDYEEVCERLYNKQIYMNRKLEENMPMFATGTYNGEQLEVVIMVWSMPLTNVNLHQSNLLNMLSKLMERSMTKAMRYMDSAKNSTYVNGTNVMETSAFSNMLDIYCTGEQEGVLEYTLLKVVSYEGEVEKLYEELGHMVRGTDYLGRSQDGNIYILLTNSNEEDSEWVRKRCEDRGVVVDRVKKNKGKTVQEVFGTCNF